LRRHSRRSLIGDIKRDVDRDVDVARKVRLPWWGVVCVGFGALPVYWLFDHLGRSNLGLPAAVATAVLGFTIDLKRNLGRRTWFWITITILTGVHVALLVLVPWPDKWIPAAVFAAIGSFDLVAMLVIIDAVGRLVGAPDDGSAAPRPSV